MIGRGVLHAMCSNVGALRFAVMIGYGRDGVSRCSLILLMEGRIGGAGEMDVGTGILLDLIGVVIGFE